VVSLFRCEKHATDASGWVGKKSNGFTMKYLRNLKIVGLLLLASCEHPEKKQEIELEEEFLEEEIVYEDEIFPQEVIRDELSECPIF
jgi:hypothetical protein